MWYKSQGHLPLRYTPEVPRGLRALRELSEATEKELPLAKIELDEVTDGQARRQIRKRLGGGAVTLDVLLNSPEQRRFRDVFIEWVRREKWWLAALVLTISISMLAAFVADGEGATAVTILLWILDGGMVVVLCLGTTVGSRLLMMVVPGLVGVGVAAQVASYN